MSLLKRIQTSAQSQTRGTRPDPRASDIVQAHTPHGLTNLATLLLDMGIEKAYAAANCTCTMALHPDNAITLRLDGATLSVNTLSDLTARARPQSEALSTFYTHRSFGVPTTRLPMYVMRNRDRSIVAVQSYCESMVVTFSFEGALWRLTILPRRSGFRSLSYNVQHIGCQPDGQADFLELRARPEVSRFRFRAIDADVLSERLRHTAALLPGTTFILKDYQRRSLQTQRFYVAAEQGLLALFEHHFAPYPLLMPPQCLHGQLPARRRIFSPGPLMYDLVYGLTHEPAVVGGSLWFANTLPTTPSRMQSTLYHTLQGEAVRAGLADDAPVYPLVILAGWTLNRTPGPTFGRGDMYVPAVTTDLRTHFRRHLNANRTQQPVAAVG